MKEVFTPPSIYIEIYLSQQSPLMFVNFGIFGTVMPVGIGVLIMRFLHGGMQVKSKMSAVRSYDIGTVLVNERSL